MTTEIKTFVIADVRGYTLFTQERGDEAAGKLAQRFAELARRGVEARGGAVLELRGDEALAVFASARQAIRAAVELQSQFVEETVADPSMPLRVGIGIDAGEAVPIEGGYRGGALNLAARLCGEAGPGEVLASREAVHLARKIEGVKYADRGQVHLKGLPEPVRMIRVIPEAGDPAELLRPYVPPRTRRRRRRRAIVIGGPIALAVVLLAVLLPILGGGEGTGSTFRPGTVLLDLATGKQTAHIPLSRLAEAAYPKFSGGNFWVQNFFPNSYVEIDPATGRMLKQISAPARDPGDIGEAWSETPFAVDGDFLWVTSADDLVKMDIDRGSEVERFRLDEIVKGEPGPAQGVAVGGGSLWVSRLVGGGQIVRLDPETGTIQHLFDPIFPHGNLAYADGSLWVADNTGVLRIDADTNTAFRARDIRGNSRVAAGGGFGWTSNEDKGVVYKVDKTGRLAATYDTGLGAGHMAFYGGTLWVANHDVGTVTGIDAITGRTTTYRFDHPVGTVAAGAGVLLVYVGKGRSVEDSINALSGTVAKFIAHKSQIGSGDPALDWNPAAFQIEYATCAKLLNHPDEPSPEGWRLQPEVAAGMPTLSPDGRTYTFTVRPGYRFSPPENQPVTAETFRYSIERALSPRLGDGTPGPQFIDDIDGERAFRTGKADQISGLEAQGDTLSITLVRPSPDFLERLALPFFCPVPTDTPIVPGGLVRGGEGVAGGFRSPSAGPYYVADRNNEEYVILKRNPNYHGPRPRSLDAIVIREGIDASIAVDMIQNEGWDGITNLGDDPLLAPHGPLAERYGAQEDSEGGLRYYAVPQPNTEYVAFNAGRPLFSDPRVRRAATYALNRSALAAVWSEVPADDVLPPSMPGYEDLDVYPDSPDLEKAKALMKGRGGTAIMGIPADCDPCRQFDELVRAALAPIGIDVKLVEVDDYPGAFLERGASFDLVDRFTFQDYADGASFLTRMLGKDVPNHWLPASVRAQVASLGGLTGEARAVAAARLAENLQTTEVPVAAVGYFPVAELLSPRIGCRVFPPFGYGVDLAALCLNEEA